MLKTFSFQIDFSKLILAREILFTAIPCERTHMALPEPLLDTANCWSSFANSVPSATMQRKAARTRIALTDEEKAGRDLLVRWMRENWTWKCA